MPLKQNNNIQVSGQFVWEIFRDSVTVPYVLLQMYPQIGLTEQELVTILRLLRPASLNKDLLTLPIIAEEFSCDETEASAFIQPLLAKEILLESDTVQGSYSMDGLIARIYELWNIEKRRKQRGIVRGKTKTEARQRYQTTTLGRLYRSFERELGRNLSPIENEKITLWLEKENQSPELIEEALRRAVFQGKANFAYIDKILFNWRRQGISSPAEIAAKDKPSPPAKKTERTAKTGERVKDTWLDDNIG